MKNTSITLATAFTSAITLTATSHVATAENTMAAPQSCTHHEIRSEAKSCLEVQYRQTMDLAAEIWTDTHKKDDVDTRDMGPTLTDEYHAFPQSCLKDRDNTLDSNETVEEFLRQAQICLAISTRVADAVDADYDFDRASEMIANAKRGRKLDLK